ncbi:MAG: sensor histidine kinase, partial [Bacteroidota bacterium]
MINPQVIVGLSVGYLVVLFLIVFLIDKAVRQGKQISKYQYIYALALPVYCTAWTFYGSVGKAVEDGWEFLTIYLGPILTMPLWWLLLRKMVRICKQQRISTLPDFISLRFGKSVMISVVASISIVIGIIPYISIQLKSIVSSFQILTSGTYKTEPGLFFWNDSAFYLVLILAVFISIFVLKSIETTDKHYGLMGAIAIDSIVKLLAFLCVGLFVCYGLFEGFGDLFGQATDSMRTKFTAMPKGSGVDWFFLLLLSMSAILLLPRQFQVAVTENRKEADIKAATVIFPIYLLLINLFVIPIALAGDLTFSEEVNPDSYVLAMPLLYGKEGLAAFTFLGGFSAAVIMIIVSTSALSMIASNNVFVPLFLKGVENKKILASIPLRSRRLAVFVVLFFAYLYYRLVADAFPIVSIGLISFAAIAQFLPSVLGALYWKHANKRGALAGLIAGFSIWFFTLVVPTIIEIGLLPASLLEHGLFGISLLKPESLFGSSMSPVTHGTFWSLLINGLLFFLLSIFSDQTAKEQNTASLFVNVDFGRSGDDRLVWKGKLVQQDLIALSNGILGKDRTNQLIDSYESINGNLDHQKANAKFVNYIERMLTGAVGSASARLMISSIAQEEEIEVNDIVTLLKESNAISVLNDQLKEKSWELTNRTKELEQANERLQNLDAEKDDFISTVTHELRTPLTSIKAFVEIVQDNPEIEERDHFLTTINTEIDRMTRLINQVLEIEKLESGAVTLNQIQIIPHQIVEDSLSSMSHLLQSRNIELIKNFPEELKLQQIIGDEDRLKQVFINLISNSAKYSNEINPKIEINASRKSDFLSIAIEDNGKGIKPENLSHIFDKFFQARDQNLKKPKGSGLGLS